MLSANLGNFDETVDPAKQITKDNHEVIFHRWTDENFPPIAGVSGRFQYRIPKLFGWQMLPGHDIYMWFDGSCSLRRNDSIQWYLEQMGDADVVFFKHNLRSSIKDEVDHVEEKLVQKHAYMIPRYENGLHKEFYEDVIKKDPYFVDDKFYTSTAFIYRNNHTMRKAMKWWWFYQSRYYSVDQISQPYAMYMAKAKVAMIDVWQFNVGHLSLVYRHK